VYWRGVQDKIVNRKKRPGKTEPEQEQ